MSRAHQHLCAPPSSDRLKAGFPSRTIRAGTKLYRTHRAELGPWWFNGNGYGRFDLTPPAGTCYGAESEVIAVLEKWAGICLIPRTEVTRHMMSTLVVDRDVRVADVTSNAAISFGVTSEISTTADYDLTQQWANALRAAGFGGVRYWARHELTHRKACVALFGMHGDHADTPTTPSEYTVLSTQPLADRNDLWRALQEDTGIEVLDIP